MSNPALPNSNPPSSDSLNSDLLDADLLNSKTAPAESLEQISDLIHATAKQREGDCLALLELLRSLNDLHYEIRETIFREALPDNRQKLYSLLKDIEQEGGWPYIPRMKLLALLENMDLESTSAAAVDDSKTEQT